MNLNSKFNVIVAGLLLIVGCISITLLGCGGSSAETVLQDANGTNIQKLTNLYNQYQAEHGFVGPDSVETLKEYIENDIPDLIKKRINLTSTDEVFVSERDGKPFSIRFEIVGSARGCKEPAVFESEGVNGKFMVGFLNMATREVDKTEYDSLWAGNGTP